MSIFHRRKQKNETKKLQLGMWSDGGWLGIMWTLAAIALAGILALASSLGLIEMFFGRFASDYLKNLAEFILGFVVTGMAFVAGLVVKSSSSLVFSEEGWKWRAWWRTLDGQTWDEAGGIRLKIGAYNRLEILNMDGSVRRRIPMSTRREYVEPILTEFDRRLPAARIRSMQTPEKSKAFTARLREATTLCFLLAAGVFGIVLSVYLIATLNASYLYTPLPFFVSLMALLGLAVIAYAVLAIRFRKRLQAREGEPALFRFPLAGTSWLKMINDASNHVFSRKRRLAHLTMIEVQDGYIDLICLGKTTRIMHGEFPMRLEQNRWRDGDRLPLIVIEANPEVAIPNYAVGQISLLDLLETLRAGDRPDPKLLATDVIEWLYRDQDLDDELEQTVNT
jgi:hypothetical protein